MSCEYCDDGDGVTVFPYYGLAPHRHDARRGWIRSTVMLPREEWPDNFRPDPDAENCGVYMYCPHCGDGERPAVIGEGE